MAKRGRVVLGGLLFVLVIFAIIVFLGYHLLTKSLPKITGTTNLDILDKTVDVYRDSFGVPHIFAQTEEDLFKAAGYVTAQDRLWQMDFSRRIASGRLSEIFGKSALERDKYIRTWGFHRTAKKILKVLSPESRAALQAYADGVNAFIAENLHRLPLEFPLLRYEPDPWKIEDSLAITRLMAWRLSFSWYVDLVLNELVAKLGVREARQVFPDFPRHGPTIISSGATTSSRGLSEFIGAGLALREFLGIDTAAIGSNSWVVSGEKSVSGKPLLANDPHLELTTPSIWYEMHLVGGPINVAGVALPGTPGVLIGHNQSIAWGLTNGMVDDVDFYLEAINQDDSTKYRSGTQWQDFEEIREDIFVKDDRPVALTIQETENGPVVSNIHPVLAGRDIVYSMSWVGHEPSDELAALLKLQVARNSDDVKEALKHFKVPAQNFVWASVDGDIGYQLAGSVPIRRNTTGILPHQGWTRRGQWQRYVPFDRLPSLHNPASGFIATANNKIVD
ncbi:penicillin acylase family protein, partial [bacterium]|nr:penicillin acylase family protein [bacterium]